MNNRETNKSFDEISMGISQMKEIRDKRIALEQRDKNQLINWFKTQDKK